MIRLAGIGHGRCCHRYLQLRENIIDLLRPVHAILFRQCQMHSDTHEHFLRCFQNLMGMGTHQIPFFHELQTAVGEQVIALILQICAQLINLRITVCLPYIITVISLFFQIFQFFTEYGKLQLLHAGTDFLMQRIGKKAGSDIFPFGCLFTD